MFVSHFLVKTFSDPFFLGSMNSMSVTAVIIIFLSPFGLYDLKHFILLNVILYYCTFLSWSHCFICVIVIPALTLCIACQAVALLLPPPKSTAFHSTCHFKARQIRTRLTVTAVGSDFHQAGLRLKPQLVRLETVSEPQFGYIYTVWKQKFYQA